MNEVQHCVGHPAGNRNAFLVRWSCLPPCQGKKPCIPTCCDPGEGGDDCMEGAVDLGGGDSSDLFRCPEIAQRIEIPFEKMMV